MLYINSNYTNLGYKIYTAILKNHMQKTLDAIIDENQSVATKNKTILHTFSTIRYLPFSLMLIERLKEYK